MKKEIKKNIDFSKLSKRGKLIDWKNSIGYSMSFIYDDISGELKLINYKDGIATIEFQEKQEDMFIGHLYRCQLGKFLNKITSNFKYDIGQIINNDKQHIKITRQEYRANTINSTKKYKKYQYKCLNCGYDCGSYYKGGIFHDALWITESNLNSLNGCACCSNEITVPGINDIPTTAPWMVDYFQGGYDEAKRYNKNSNKKIYSICPRCNTLQIKPKRIQDIYINHNIGCHCEDGFSYPEKFLYSLLKQLNVEFITQISCANFKWIQKYRYDFYLPEYNCIIEVHGMQHYEECNLTSKTLKEEQENDKLKEELAKQNNITYYIIIDARYSNIEHIKSSILNSDIYSLFDLNSINWAQCDYFAGRTSMKINIINYINNNQNKYKRQEIADYFNVSLSYITNVIRYGKKHNLLINYRNKEGGE